ncbi:MAG: hypothetical protein M1816_002170 [Peltula sp. TS41687]|nr:MAG: hypothetical protein M1816_002170 [Peltula sp. TS41687]
MPRAATTNCAAVGVDEFWLSGPNFDPFDALGISPDDLNLTARDIDEIHFPHCLGPKRRLCMPETTLCTGSWPGSRSFGQDAVYLLGNPANAIMGPIAGRPGPARISQRNPHLWALDSADPEHITNFHGHDYSSYHDPCRLEPPSERASTATFGGSTSSSGTGDMALELNNWTLQARAVYSKVSLPIQVNAVPYAAMIITQETSVKTYIISKINEDTGTDMACRLEVKVLRNESGNVIGDPRIIFKVMNSSMSPAIAVRYVDALVWLM